MLRLCRDSLILAVLFCAVCGIGYPLVMTCFARLALPQQANGSLVYEGGKVVGSALLGQQFTRPYFMKGRPSAVNYNTYTEAQKADGSYAGVATGSANYAPSNPALAERVVSDADKLRAAYPELEGKTVPADLVTASGSGLDPHISPASAMLQISSISKVSGIPADLLTTWVNAHTKGKFLGVFGEETVNVLGVNLEIARHLGILEK